MSALPITYVNLENKRAVIREDFNVPLMDGKITDDTRIKMALPTIELALEAGATVILLSHLGRPTEGEEDETLSLAPVAERLSVLLDRPVPLIKDWIDGIELEQGAIVLCENVRFQKGETDNDPTLSKQIAALGDVFVMDAFATAHRCHASTYGAATHSPLACAGLLLMSELEALKKAAHNPTPPLTAVIGGSKVSTKLKLLHALMDSIDDLIVGGGMANTFLAAKGIAIGQSLYEPELLDTANELLTLAETRGITIHLPTDVVVATEISKNAVTRTCDVSDIHDDEMILDFGPNTSAALTDTLTHARTIVWNGPVGVFEFDAFAAGTKKIAEAIAKSDAFSIAGGGDTLAAIEKFGITDQLSYISTGGGAFLQFLEGQPLPALDPLDYKETTSC